MDTIQQPISEAGLIVESKTARRIAICIDGTNNKPGETRTNVQRLYSMLPRIPGEQLTYYQPGVGTLEPIGVLGRGSRRTMMLVDMASAVMLKRHACAAYEFLCQTYLDGDEIYLFGFSRGAHTARVIAGMLGTVGILHPGMHEMVSFAWDAYSSWSPLCAEAHTQDESTARGRQSRAWHNRTRNFNRTYSRPARVKFLGLWDTVSSVGLPWAPTLYNYTDSNPIVDIVRHAVSLDERRVFYVNRPWTGTSGDIKEVWFAGVHSDVGGGYAGTDALSKLSLAWMLSELGRVTPLAVDRAVVDAAKLPFPGTREFQTTSISKRHDELDKVSWRFAEMLPIPRWEQVAGKWTHRWSPHASRPRVVPGNALVHGSVETRRIQDPSYRPSNLGGAPTYVV